MSEGEIFSLTLVPPNDQTVRIKSWQSLIDRYFFYCFSLCKTVKVLPLSTRQERNEENSIQTPTTGSSLLHPVLLSHPNILSLAPTHLVALRHLSTTTRLRTKGFNS